ncbi:hypothetical protein [Methylorubrum extorquens]
MLEHLKRKQVEDLLGLLEDLPRKYRNLPAPPSEASSQEEEGEDTDESENPLVTNLRSMDVDARAELVGLVYVGRDKDPNSYDEGINIVKGASAEEQVAALRRYGLLLENYIRAGLARVQFRH